MHVSDHGGLLRARDGGEQPFELFFDLVYVFAVTQLSHRLLDEPIVVSILETLLLVLVVWSGHHNLGHQLVRPKSVVGAPDAGQRDARQPVHVGRDPGGLRRARADVRLGLRNHPGGACREAPVILTVDAAAMHAAGHASYQAANGVWLTDHVPPGDLSRWPG